MRVIFAIPVWSVCATFRSRSDLVLENLASRHQRDRPRGLALYFFSHIRSTLISHPDPSTGAIQAYIACVSATAGTAYVC